MVLCGCHGKESFESLENLFAVNICKIPHRQENKGEKV